MRVKVYQIDSERDPLRRKFFSLDETRSIQGKDGVDASIYDEVLNADMDVDNLEDIFTRLNTEGHPLHRGHSLSVSDVVVTDKGAFFCDSFGFQQIDFNESQTHKPDNLMRVLYVEPHRIPYETEIPHTLEGMQQAVGGLIEPVYLDDDIVIVGNEEAKLEGLDGNRRLENGIIMAGPFFICGEANEEFRSLTDEEVVKYMDQFHEPENISPEEVEADMGFTIYGFMM